MYPLSSLDDVTDMASSQYYDDWKKSRFSDLHNTNGLVVDIKTTIIACL